MLNQNPVRRGRRSGHFVRMTCFACGMETMGRSAAKYSRCDECRDAGVLGVLPSPEYDKAGGTRAMAAVSAAIRDGLLLPPAKHRCVDCGAQAQQYDHRDYRKPLDVAPVCRSCNKRRGPAIPLDGSIRQRIADGYVPYAFRDTAVKLFKVMGLPVDALADMPKKLTLEHWKALLPLVERSSDCPELKADVSHA